MRVHNRVCSIGVAVVLAIFGFGRPSDLNAAQAKAGVSSASLDKALDAGDLERARKLVLNDPDGADQVFLGYLQETITQTRSKEAEVLPLERARRLADVFFRIYEFDFERGIVSTWEKVSLAQKQALMPILRDHFAAYEESRKMSLQKPQPIDKDRRFLEKAKALASRYRTISFGKGELQAMLWASSLDAGQAWKTWQLAKTMGDEVGEAWGAYYYSIWSGEGQPEIAAQRAVEAAQALRLPKLLQMALTRQAWRALSRDDYDAHIDYFRKGLEVIRTIPVRQTMVGKASYGFRPGEAWFLMALWRAYELKNNPEARGMLEQGRMISRQHGGKVGELAFLIEATQQFIRPGVFADVAAQAESLARELRNSGWLAEFLMTKAGGLDGTREFAKAIEAATEAANLYKKMGDQGHFADCLSQRASFRVESKNLEGALADYAEAIKIFDELGLTEEAISLRLDAAGALRSQPKSALKFTNDALAAAEKIDDPELIRSALVNRARLLETDSPSQSLQDLQKALVCAERYGKEIGRPGEVLAAMRALSQSLRRLGNYSEAVETEKRRAERAREEGLHDAEADAYYWLLTIHASDLGEPTMAAQYAEKYTALMLRPGRRLGFNNYNRIASAYYMVGQPTRALEFWAKGLQVAKETPAGEHFQRMARINVARTDINIGDYDAAIAELKEEDALIERTFQAYGKPIELQKAEWFNKIAYAHALSGDLEQAMEESRRSIEFEFKTPPGTALAGYYAYFTPGEGLMLVGKFDEAIDFHKKRRDRAREVKSSSEERSALERLGLTFMAAGKIEEARQALGSAVEIDRQPPGPQTGSLAGSLLGLGRLEHLAGNLAKAKDLLLEARKAANPYDLNQVWQVERAMAQVFAQEGSRDLAEKHFELALYSLEGVHERLRPEEFSLRFGIDRLRVYDEYAAYLAKRAVETRQEADADKALLLAERRRVQALWDLMAAGWSRLQPEEVPEPLRRVREAEARLEAKLRTLREQSILPPEKRNQAIVARLEAELEPARKEHARLLAALAQGKFRFSSPSGLPVDLISQIRKKLGQSRMLIEYLVTDEAAFAFVLSTAGMKVEKLPLNRQNLREQVQRLLQPFYRLRSGELDLARLGFDAKTSYGLYQQLFAPLERHLGRVPRILVVPDDVLCYLPVELLVDKLPEGRTVEKVLFAQYEKAEFLVRRFVVSYQVAASQLLSEPESPPPSQTADLVLAMANPTARPDLPPGGQEDPLKRRLRSGSLSGAFAPLPGSAGEIEGIRRCFPAGTVTILTGADATEAQYKALCSQSGIVHLATHAIAADDQPFYSTLILAPDNRTGEDGFLQAYEILRYPLRAKLVVLSACETARGPLGRGEGLVGLVSAFRQAGAKSVLATQWSIDESTAGLMTAFYRAMTAGRDASRALREAKLDIMKKRVRLGDVEVSLAHPFFWAPFVLIGSSD